jgi:hypothetical protein
MPLELQIIRASEFIRLDPGSHLDLEASKQALQMLARACLKRGIGAALLDLRNLPVLPRPHFSPTELAMLVRAFRAAGFSRQQRLAILYHDDVHGRVRDFAFISRLQGLRVQAFKEFEQALMWLSEPTKEAAQKRPAEVEIPIGKARAEIKKLPASPGRAGAGVTPQYKIRRLRT